MRNMRDVVERAMIYVPWPGIVLVVVVSIVPIEVIGKEQSYAGYAVVLVSVLGTSCEQARILSEIM